MSPSPPLAAYTGVLLQTQGKHLLCTGSDGESSVTAKLAVTSPEAGRCLVVPGPLSTYLSQLRDVAITVSVEEGADLVIEPEGSPAYHFRQLGATFPNPKLENQGLQPAETNELSDALAAVRHAAEGVVQLRSDENQLVLVATDRFRIAHARLAGAGFGSLTGVVPLNALELVGRHKIDHIGIDARGRTLRAKGPEVFVSVRLVDEPFPDVGQIIHEKCRAEVTLARQPLLEALERLQAVAGKTPVRLEVGPQGLVLEVTNVELGSGRETIELASSPEEFSCLVNAAFLKDAAAAQQDELTIGWNGSLNPLHLRSEGDLAIRTVVMPVRG